MKWEFSLDEGRAKCQADMGRDDSAGLSYWAKGALSMKPDIVSFIRHFGERSESWLYDQVAHLKRHRVHVLTYRYRNPDEYPHAPVTVLPSPEAECEGESQAKPWYREQRGQLLQMVKDVTRPIRSAWRGWRESRHAVAEGKQIAPFVRESDIRVVQAHFGWTGPSVAAALDGWAVPFVVWFYGSDVFRGSPAACVRGLVRSGAIFCCTSNALKTRLVEVGCPAERVDVFYPGVHAPERLPAKRTLGKGPLRILSVGRLCDFKNPEGLVQVAGLLRERGLDYSWDCLGEGPLKPAVEQAISELGVGNRFQLRGSVPHEQVVEHMLEADVLVHNATIAPDGGRESFGVVLAEASAAALPIVSVRVGGIPEIVQDGQTGYLVNEGDIEGMARKVLELAHQPELRGRMGRAAHAWARENVEATQQTEKLDAFYDCLSLGSSPPY